MRKMVITFLVARGTAREPDWVDDNLKQGVGLGSDQYDQVTAVSKTTTKKVGKRNVTITGHSMGGGTSSTAGIATGSDTYAFDPAGVHPNTARKYGENTNGFIEYLYNLCSHRPIKQFTE